MKLNLGSPTAVSRRAFLKAAAVSLALEAGLIC
jgi:hypothetical protein